MRSAVKISERLMALAKQEARGTHRSITAQIEHWASIGRAVEVMLAYGEVLALKRAGEALPIPANVRREDVHNLLRRLAVDTDRTGLKARLQALGAPLYETDPRYPGMIVEVLPDGTKRPGRFLLIHKHLLLADQSGQNG